MKSRLTSSTITASNSVLASNDIKERIEFGDISFGSKIDPVDISPIINSISELSGQVQEVSSSIVPTILDNIDPIHTDGENKNIYTCYLDNDQQVRTNTTSNINAQAMGVATHAQDKNSYAWSGVIEEFEYQTHGEGTFNINPRNGIKGFYIGEKSLEEIIGASVDINESLAEMAKKALAAISKNGNNMTAGELVRIITNFFYDVSTLTKRENNIFNQTSATI